MPDETRIHDASLRKAFPLYADLSEISCGSGWYVPLANLGAEIDLIDPSIRASQVKEKFGGLRVYIRAMPEDRDKRMAVEIAVFRAVLDCEDRCELCGKLGATKGHRPGSHWIQTLCINDRAPDDA